MAKALVKPQATSSVASMLQHGVGAQALARPEIRPDPMLPTPIVQHTPVQIVAAREEKSIAPSESTSVLRQFSLTPHLDRVLKKVVTVYSEATGLDLKHSEIMRALLLALDHAIPELTREASRIGPLKRPKNDKGTEPIRDLMERKITKAIVSGMRAAAALE